MWLGQQVRFRTLHLTPGVANENGLAIVDFVDRFGKPLKLEVKGDVLFGRRKTKEGVVTDEIVKGECSPISPWDPNCLTGAMLTLRSYNQASQSSDTPHRPMLAQAAIPGGDLSDATKISPPLDIYLKITKISETPFWTCRGCTDSAPDKAHLYTFMATRRDNGCQVELCKPDLAKDYNGNLAGTAVIFHGDVYDEDTYKVHETGSTGDLFNIACLGTAISKLHLFRHTWASRGGTTVEQRQTLLRLLTADYCGQGHPFTQDGLPIHLDFINWHGLEPTKNSGYRETGSNEILDALWDENGAACLFRPRLLLSDMPHPSEDDLLEKIYNTCPSNHRLLKSGSSSLGEGDHLLRKCDGQEAPPVRAKSMTPSPDGNPS